MPIFGAFAKKPVDISRLKDITKKVYVSVEVQSMFNFLENPKPHKNDGITFCVTPSIRVDYYLGSYFFVGGGLSFNTAGGRYDFISSRMNGISDFSFSEVARRTMSVSYIEMPVYVKVQSNYMNNWAVQGLLGFSWGIKVLSSYKDVYSGFTHTNVGNQDLKLKCKYEEGGALGKRASLWTVSGIIEVRALYRATDKLQLFVGAGYQAGFANILSKKNTVDEEFHSGKPGQVVVSAGIVF
jgi:hypothetical protein